MKKIYKYSHCQYSYITAYRIHISNDTYSELVLSGGFICEERGILNVKVILRNRYLLNLQAGKCVKSHSIMANMCTH